MGESFRVQAGEETFVIVGLDMFVVADNLPQPVADVADLDQREGGSELFSLKAISLRRLGWRRISTWAEASAL